MYKALNPLKQKFFLFGKLYIHSITYTCSRTHSFLFTFFMHRCHRHEHKLVLRERTEETLRRYVVFHSPFPFFCLSYFPFETSGFVYFLEFFSLDKAKAVVYVQCTVYTYHLCEGGKNRFFISCLVSCARHVFTVCAGSLSLWLVVCIHY